MASQQPAFAKYYVGLSGLLCGVQLGPQGARQAAVGVEDHHAAQLATRCGVGEAVIGLTIVAAGTSMPELATSMAAALRKQPDIAMGTIVGSNIFNILGILGLSSLSAPLHSPGISLSDHGFMIAFSLLLIPLLYTGRVLHRLEGLVLVGLYSVYLYSLWPN